MKEISALISKTQRPKKHTRESAFKIAQEYKDLKSLREERRDIEAFLKRNGIFDEATQHIQRKINYRTKQDILQIISKYKYWDEFIANEPTTFNYIQNINKLSIDKSYLVPKYIKERGHPLSWSRQMVSYEIKKYKDIKEIKKKRIALFQRMIHLGMTENNDPSLYSFKSWNKKRIIEVCKKYRFFGELLINEGNAPINAAKRLGIQIPLPRVQYAGETYLKIFLEKLLNIYLYRCRPNFLKNLDSGRNLELDGYNEELNIAFEHDGDQHFKETTRNILKEVQARDKLKNKLCNKNKTKLIRIKDLIFHYKMNETKIKQELSKQLIRLGIKYNKNKMKQLIIFDRSVVINKRKS